MTSERNSRLQNVISIPSLPPMRPLVNQATAPTVYTKPAQSLTKALPAPQTNRTRRRNQLPQLPQPRPVATIPSLPGRNQKVMSQVTTATIVIKQESNVQQDTSPCECCICYELTVAFDKKTDCGHSVCSDCTGRLVKLTCPICRSPLKGGYVSSIIDFDLIGLVQNTNYDRYIEIFEGLIIPNIEGLPEDRKGDIFETVIAFVSILSEQNINMPQMDVINALFLITFAMIEDRTLDSSTTILRVFNEVLH